MSGVFPRHNQRKLKMESYGEILEKRLKDIGMDSENISGFMRTLSSSFKLDPNQSLRSMNNTLDRLGWNGFHIDYHTFELAIALFEFENTTKEATSNLVREYSALENIDYGNSFNNMTVWL